jgi:hypothetical protein
MYVLFEVILVELRVHIARILPTPMIDDFCFISYCCQCNEQW